MVHVVHADNVNQALHRGLTYLLDYGVQQDSRNGSVLAAPVPVCTTYTNPQRRVLFNPIRDANPFFHLMESIWMIAGKNDIAWPAKFAKNLANYSDDGVTQWGAYGYRWRNWFSYDQLRVIIHELIANPTSRRCVLGMWDPAEDLHLAVSGGKDVPCNTHAYFEVRDGKLNMTVCNRSNDVIWGAYGANAVHFSFLQEFLAIAIGVKVGVYNQFSNNYHVYLDKYPREKMQEISRVADLYVAYTHNMEHYPIMRTDWQEWSNQAVIFCEDPYELVKGADPFWEDVARPMYLAFEKRSVEEAKNIRAVDWRIAAIKWLEKRAK